MVRDVSFFSGKSRMKGDVWLAIRVRCPNRKDKIDPSRVESWI